MNQKQTFLVIALVLALSLAKVNHSLAVREEWSGTIEPNVTLSFPYVSGNPNTRLELSIHWTITNYDSNSPVEMKVRVFYGTQTIQSNVIETDSIGAKLIHYTNISTAGKAGTWKLSLELQNTLNDDQSCSYFVAATWDQSLPPPTTTPTTTSSYTSNPTTTTSSTTTVSSDTSETTTQSTDTNLSTSQTTNQASKVHSVDGGREVPPEIQGAFAGTALIGLSILILKRLR